MIKSKAIPLALISPILKPLLNRMLNKNEEMEKCGVPLSLENDDYDSTNGG
ncbi:MAG: hypothetical protein WAM14_02425 [Candidatus Nitrosopolaris sp.]